MEHLTRLSTSADASVYALGGDHEGSVRRYMVSTPSSRAICNRPEVLGCEYTTALCTAVTAALVQAPFRTLIEGHPEARVWVLNFLRGGLNFDLRGALHLAYGFNTHSSAFMSSQRYRVDGRWVVREDMYRKLHIPPDALILTGDVVATGVTVDNGLRVLIDELLDIGSSIRSLVFFTIGCHKLEKRMAELDERFRTAFPSYEGSHIVYLEGKFRLVDSRTGLRIGLPGTDLIRRDALLTPELEASQYDQVCYPLERCAIYDAGSRAFDIPEYVEDVTSYWQELDSLAHKGFTLREALAERWPEHDYHDRSLFLERRRQLWQGVPDHELETLHDRFRQRWTDELHAEDGTAEALARVCAERVATMQGFLAQR